MRKVKDDKFNKRREFGGQGCPPYDTDKFGNKVIDILSLLDEFDTNNDGVINNKDNTNLALWQDKNQNGKTDKDELIKFANLNLLVA